MPHIPFHPAPGLGDLLPGSFVVPQNPIRDAGTPLVPSPIAVTGGRPYRVAKMGDLLPGKFVVPQNPLVNQLVDGALQRHQAGQVAAAMSAGKGMCCSSCAGHGMGDLSDIETWLTSTNSMVPVPNWLLVGGGALVAWMIFMPGGSEYRQKSRALRSQYRGYRRAARATSSAVGSIG